MNCLRCKKTLLDESMECYCEKCIERLSQEYIENFGKIDEENKKLYLEKRTEGEND